MATKNRRSLSRTSPSAWRNVTPIVGPPIHTSLRWHRKTTRNLRLRISRMTRPWDRIRLMLGPTNLRLYPIIARQCLLCQASIPSPTLPNACHTRLREQVDRWQSSSLATLSDSCAWDNLVDRFFPFQYRSSIGGRVAQLVRALP
jgi:hypothetical protein